MEPIIVNKISPEIVFMDNSINNAETKIASPLKPIKNIKEFLWLFKPTIKAKELTGTTKNKSI